MIEGEQKSILMESNPFRWLPCEFSRLLPIRQLFWLQELRKVKGPWPARSILIERQTGGRRVHNFVDKVDMESADEFVRYFF